MVLSTSLCLLETGRITDYLTDFLHRGVGRLGFFMATRLDITNANSVLLIPCFFALGERESDIPRLRGISSSCSSSK